MLKRAFLAYVLVELAVLVGLTWAVGLGWTLLVLLSTAVVGFAMAGSQARRQLMRLQEFQANPRGANPRGVVADSAMIAPPKATAHKSGRTYGARKATAIVERKSAPVHIFSGDQRNPVSERAIG